MHRMKIHLRTQTPVILSAQGNVAVMTETHECFSGTILRGIFAGQFIERKKLGNAAHEDADFMRLFYGDLCFVAAYPVHADTGRRAIVLPLSLQRSKDGGEIMDLMQEGTAPAPGFKSVKGFGTIESNVIYSVDVKTGISFHMSRTDLMGEGGAERLAGKSADGGIYNYEAITAGQEFEGIVCGSAEQLGFLRDTLGTEFTCHAGRSKYTQYGLCKITLTPPEPVPPLPITQGGQLLLRLETPFLSRCGIPGDAASMLREIVEELNQRMGGLSLVNGARSIFAKAVDIDNFVGVWGMKRPRETGLAAGSVFAVNKEGAWQEGEAAALASVLYGGVGRRRAEGFGQLRIWDGAELRWNSRKNERKSEARPLSEKTKALGRRILLARLMEQVRLFAAADAEAAADTFPKGARHAFSRLEVLLGMQPSGAQTRMRRLPDETHGEHTELRKMTRQVRIGLTSLYQYFTETDLADMPYFTKGSAEFGAHEELVKAVREMDLPNGIEGLLRTEEIYYAYWHAFFRYGRKNVKVQEEGGAL